MTVLEQGPARMRRRHWVALVVGVLPSIPLVLWLALIAFTPQTGPEEMPRLSVLGIALGWAVMILPVTVTIGAVLAGVVYLVAYLISLAHPSTRRSPQVRR
ncbi:hypothetical protein M3697_16535 [Janibacter melonis]|uniref:hypothetical protein n=1 Tax=Janibacter melonis TaxID=262209 RepID=UPI002043C53B|nr:hypothetical protein [Janibacter melonis]MCM3556695.1 hypothetical protein [Janibacter melonis]